MVRSPLVCTVAGAALLLCATVSLSADDFLTRAAAQMREKDFGAAYVQAAQSPESPRRAFLMGTAALRQGNAALAVLLLNEAEQKLPLVADYAVLYQAEALLKLKKYVEASAKAASIPRLYPGSQLIRRADKLYADTFFEAGDYAGGLKALQTFVEKYPSGGDSVDALFLSARCREELNDRAGAATVYRTIWLNNPASAQARKSMERLKELEKAGVKVVPHTPEELLRRASSLYSQNEFGASLVTLQSIPMENLPPALVNRIDLRTGMALYRQRSWKQAEKTLARVANSALPAIRSEARFWLAKSLERQDQEERAFAVYLELAAEGRKQEFADDALMEAAGLRRGQGKYAEASRLFEKVVREYHDSKFVPRAQWEIAWCRYLARDFAAAAEALKPLLNDESARERALYWLARAQESLGSPDAAASYRQLLDDYPAGFYATWYREQKGLPDQREPLGNRTALAELALPSGYDKPLLLASLGLIEDARVEMAALRKKAGDRKVPFPGLVRVYLEMGDYGSAIALFLQNRPVRWEKAQLPLWTAGYPLAYTDTVGRHAAANGLSEGLVYALILAESGFNPVIKSHAGAIGLMQLMPNTAKQTAREKGAFNPHRLVMPDFNVKLGTRHLKELIRGYDGDLVYSIAAYNAGAAAVERWRRNLKGLRKDEFIESIPYQETRDYVKKVYASAATYRALYGMK